MDPNTFTRKTQDAVSEAQNLAIRHGHQQIDCEHLMHALVAQEQGLAGQILRKLSVAPDAYLGAIDAEIAKLPSVSGPGGAPGPDHDNAAHAKGPGDRRRHAQAL